MRIQYPQDAYRKSSLNLWIAWLFATSITGVIFIIPVLLIADLSDSSFSGDNIILPIGLCGLDLLLGGWLIGVFQNLVLKRYAIANNNSWVVASLIGFVAAISVVDFLTTVTIAPVATFLGGVVFGIAQWFTLRAYFQRSLIWIPVNAVAWYAGAFILQMINAIFLPVITSTDYNFPFRPSEAVAYWAMSFTLSMLTYGLITASALVWIAGSSDIENMTI